MTSIIKLESNPDAKYDLIDSQSEKHYQNLVNKFLLNMDEIDLENANKEDLFDKFIEENPNRLQIIITLAPTNEFISYYLKSSVVKKYLTDAHIKHAIEKNILKIQINGLNNDSFDDELINISDKVSKFRTFELKTFKERLAHIQTKLPKIDLEQYVLCKNMVNVLTENYSWEKFKESKDNYVFMIVPYLSHITFDHFIHHQIKQNNDYFVYENNNIKVIILRKYIGDHKKIFYHYPHVGMSYFKDNIYCTLDELQNINERSTPFTITANINNLYYYNTTCASIKLQQLKLNKMVDSNIFNKCIINNSYYDKDLNLTECPNVCMESLETYYAIKKKISKMNLRGKHIIITGVRTGLGYNLTLHLLRMGATIYGTTRYPYIAWYNYSNEIDYDMWKHKLVIFNINYYKDTDNITHLINYISVSKIDVVINTANCIRENDIEYIRNNIKINKELKTYAIDSNCDWNKNLIVKCPDFLELKRKEINDKKFKFSFEKTNMSVVKCNESKYNIVNNAPNEMLNKLLKYNASKFLMINLGIIINNSLSPNLGNNLCNKLIIAKHTYSDKFVFCIIDSKCANFQNIKNMDYTNGCLIIINQINKYFNDTLKHCSLIDGFNAM